MLMPAAESQNLPGPLEQAAALYRDAAVQLPVTGAMIARQARHFASNARLGRDKPQAMRRLDEVTGGLGDVPTLSSLLPRVLDDALALMRADFGTLQLLDPVTGSLRLVTQSGLDPGFVEHFAVVDDDHSACGRAARDCAQIVIADVNANPEFAPHRGIAAASGVRAVQSTPLADEAGHLIGVVSTHFRRPHRPSGLDLRIMELYADVAGAAIAAHLAATGDDNRGDPIGQAATSLDDTMARFAEYIVNRLFSVGLSLDSAHSIVGKGPAGDRVAAATDEVDHLIRDIRDRVFAERGQETQAGLPGKSRLDDQERSAQSADRAALLREQMARTARGLQDSAAGYAALLEQGVNLRQPQRMDYPAEIKRWRAVADQAGQLARRWEQSPLPGSHRQPPGAKARPCRVTCAPLPLPPLSGTPGIARRSARTPRRVPGSRRGCVPGPRVRAAGSNAGPERGGLRQLLAASPVPGRRDAARHALRSRARCGPSWCPPRAWKPDTGRCRSRR
jgi:GAF domain